MSNDGISMLVRGAKGFGSRADRQDPRTPEQRAERQRQWMLHEQWRRLPWSAPVNLALLCLLMRAGHLSAGPGPAILLALAGLLALLGLAATPATGSGRLADGGRWRHGALILEAGLSATAIVWVVGAGGNDGFLLAVVAMLLSPLARGGTAAWIHLALVTGAAIVPATQQGPWTLLALLLLVLLCAGATARLARDSAQRIRAMMDGEELNALCTQLGTALRDLRPVQERP